MAWIEGIGDELVMAVILLFALLICVAAWMSTYVNDPPEIADHVTPSGVVSQNLDFPGSIEDDLERIANEIEEEAEAVENEISVLTLQRTAFLQTLTNQGDSRDLDDEEDEDDDDQYEDDDEEDDLPPTEANSETQATEEETIPTFEFPCPHGDSFDISVPSSSAIPSSSSSSSTPRSCDSSSQSTSETVDASTAAYSDPLEIPDDSRRLPALSNTSFSAVSAAAAAATFPPIVDASSPSPSIGVTPRPMADASVLETSLRRRAAAELARRAAAAAEGAAAAAGSSDSLAGQSSPAAPGRAAAEQTSADASNVAEDTLPATSVATSQSENTSRGLHSSHSPGDGHMTVRIKFINDVIREMRVKSTDTIRDFKATFFAEELAALNRVRLIFNGQLLSDHLSFGHYNISHNTVIHCLVSRAGNGAGGNGVAGGVGDGVDGGVGRGGVGDDVIIQELDLSRLVFPLVAVILSCVWYFRVQYRQFFNATSSVALLFLTGVFFFFVFTSLRNRRAVVVVGTPANNNNNNDNGVNNNNDAENSTNRQNGVPAS